MSESESESESVRERVEAWLKLCEGRLRPYRAEPADGESLEGGGDGGGGGAGGGESNEFWGPMIGWETFRVWAEELRRELREPE